MDTNLDVNLLNTKQAAIDLGITLSSKDESLLESLINNLKDMYIRMTMKQLLFSFEDEGPKNFDETLEAKDFASAMRQYSKYIESLKKGGGVPLPEVPRPSLLKSAARQRKIQSPSDHQKNRIASAKVVSPPKSRIVSAKKIEKAETPKTDKLTAKVASYKVTAESLNVKVKPRKNSSNKPTKNDSKSKQPQIKPTKENEKLKELPKLKKDKPNYPVFKGGGAVTKSNEFLRLSNDSNINRSSVGARDSRIVIKQNPSRSITQHSNGTHLDSKIKESREIGKIKLIDDKSKAQMEKQDAAIDAFMNGKNITKSTEKSKSESNNIAASPLPSLKDDSNELQYPIEKNIFKSKQVAISQDVSFYDLKSPQIRASTPKTRKSSCKSSKETIQETLLIETEFNDILPFNKGPELIIRVKSPIPDVSAPFEKVVIKKQKQITRYNFKSRPSTSIQLRQNVVKSIPSTSLSLLRQNVVKIDTEANGKRYKTKKFSLLSPDVFDLLRRAEIGDRDQAYLKAVKSGFPGDYRRRYFVPLMMKEAR